MIQHGKPEAPLAPRLLSPKEVARLLGVSVRTLERWRRSGSGPKWIRLEGRIRYRSGAIEALTEHAEPTNTDKHRHITTSQK